MPDDALQPDPERIRAALSCLCADDRDRWVRVGMAIKAALGDAGFDLWDTWSRTSVRYRQADAKRAWRSFRPDGGITLGTLFYEAKQNGRIALDHPGRTPGGAGGSPPPDQHSNRATVATYAQLKNLPDAFLRSLGLTDIRYRDAHAIRIPYLDREGREIAVRIRRTLYKEANRDPRFAWRKGDRPRLYGLDRLGTPESVVLVEGESDCHTLWYHGIAALGIAGANAWDEARDAAALDGIARIYVIVEPDAGGDAVKAWLARSRICERANLVDLGPYKDPSALYLDDPKAFKPRFEDALHRSRPATAHIDDARRERAAAYRNRCRSLAEHPSVLTAFESAYQGAGAVGEARIAKLLYLALTSRLLPKPVSVAVKGPSSSGKSFAVDTVLRFFPPEAVHCVTAVSDRALAYMEAELTHRVLVIYEAAGMMGEFASYLIRSLLSEGKLVYEVVERTAAGLRPRRIEKAGPTGLLVTTTAVRLHPENETRLLSLQLTDTRAQTQAVMRAIAAPNPDTIDFEPWIALQRWLHDAEHRVAIPYATTLADSIAPVAVRLRRDFGQLLALIKAHAILHQAHRDRDATGRIIATLDDYDVVRELVIDVLAEGIGAAVPPSVRETVDALAAISARGKAEVSVTELATALALDKSAASRRIAAAVQLGHLRNLEDRKGRPARLTLGEPIPESAMILPSVEVLHGCSVDRGDSRGGPPTRQPAWNPE
jgi:hypothetical protein